MAAGSRRRCNCEEPEAIAESAVSCRRRRPQEGGGNADKVAPVGNMGEQGRWHEEGCGIGSETREVKRGFMGQRRIIMMFSLILSIFLIMPGEVFGYEEPSCISSMEQNPLTIMNCSDKQYSGMQTKLKTYKKKQKTAQTELNKVRSKDNKVKKSIKKLKKKAKTKKNKKKLKALNKQHKSYTKKITRLKKQLVSIQTSINTAENDLAAVKIEEPFIRISGTVNGNHLDNLINYTVLPKGSLEWVEVESADWNSSGEVGELRNRKTVKTYVADKAEWSDEIVAINGQAWAGPWATDECTYDAGSKKWYVPETERIGGWQYAIPNPNYESELKSDPKAKKTVGTLPYSEKYAGFRICLIGMMKDNGQIITGSMNDAHRSWIAFTPEGDFCYGSNKNGELPGDEYVAAVSGARILDNGEFIENGWASGGPKTIIGTRPNGDIVLVSTVGRLSEFYSFTPYEHCEIMAYLGCDNALCMDGGGSTSMVYKFRDSDKIVNIATCGKSITSRPVANAVLFYKKNESVNAN